MGYNEARNSGNAGVISILRGIDTLITIILYWTDKSVIPILKGIDTVSTTIFPYSFVL